jgi:hypothetical protein
MSEMPTIGLYERARAWAVSEQRVAAALVYGSVARGDIHDLSDLDLLVVAQLDQRDVLWQDREALAARILGAPIIFHQEPSWQRPFRFQAWRADLVQVDLTFDQGAAIPWEGITQGFAVLVDRAGIADQLRATLASWQRPVFDAAAYDQGTWPWLWWLVGRLRHGQYWIVRYGVMDTLNNRVLPLLGVIGPGAEQTLEPPDLERLSLVLRQCRIIPPSFPDLTGA